MSTFEEENAVNIDPSPNKGNVLIMGLEDYHTRHHTPINLDTIHASVHKVLPQIHALGFGVSIVAVDPDFPKQNIARILKELHTKDFDAISVGADLRRWDECVAYLERLMFVLITECARMGKLPKFIFPAEGPTGIVDGVKRVLLAGSDDTPAATGDTAKAQALQRSC